MLFTLSSNINNSFSHWFIYIFVTVLLGAKVIKGSGYETKQVCLLYVFVSMFGLGRAQTTIDFEMCWNRAG